MTGRLAVYTRARAEATALEHMRLQGYEGYLPRHLKRRHRAWRTDFMLARLIPRYLFVAIDRLHQRWLPILSAAGPFADLVGVFHGMASDERVFVPLDLLGCTVRAQLPNTAIDPA